MATFEEVRSGPGEDPGPRLSVAAVARRLGVAPSTLRTWDRRYGLGPSSHQAGAHRRYTAADLERLVVMRRLTLEGVQPAEAARIAMAVQGVRPGLPTFTLRPALTARPASPAGASPAAASTAAGSAPAMPAVIPSVISRTRPLAGHAGIHRPPAGFGAPPGTVGLPIADPPPRTVADAAAARAIPAARAAAPLGSSTTLTRPVQGLSRSDRAPADTRGRWGGAAAPGTVIPPDSPDLPAALNLPAELGVTGPQPAPDDAATGYPVESGGRCGGGRVLALAEGTPQARGLARAAMALDSPEMWRILTEAIAAQGVLATWDRLAAPVLQAVGERWRATGEVVDVEHLFSETLADVLRAVIVRRRPPRRPNPVLLACLEKEHHTLPLHALAAALAERGVGCRLLGGGMPASSLVNAVRRTGPALVFLYAQLPVSDEAVLAELPRQRPAPRLVVGGPGWRDRSQTGSPRRVGSLLEAIEAVVAAVRA
jgi:MerR family transcriptional regulator, light-induced transcriptional regulator